MLRRRASTAGAFLLLFLAAGACAVGAELGSEGVQPRDAGPDVSLGGGRGGSDRGSGGGASTDGNAKGGSSATGGAANGDGSGGGYGGASTGGQSDARASGDTGFDGPLAVDSATGCIATQKSCGGRCVVPDERVGCALVGCDPCPVPVNGIAQCTGTECDFSCLSGYLRSGAGCIVGEGGGGATDASNDRGPTVCVASQCGGCIPFIQAPCCKPDNTCGCQFPFAPCN
jgi:hypothetical protein